MKDMVITKENLLKFLDRIAGERELYSPAKEENDHWMFRRAGSAGEIDFSYLNTHGVPKGFFFPTSERLFGYRMGEKTFEVAGVEEAIAPGVLFGVRPCDCFSFIMLDRLFTYRDYIDSYWVRRRENIVVIGLGCTTPDPTCFCTAVSCGPYSQEGSDIFLAPLDDDRFLLQAVTEKGETFLTVFHPEASEAGDREFGEREAMAVKAGELTDGSVRAAEVIERLGILGMDMFEHPVWEALSEKCLNCGTCTYLCPTCHCFDIQDVVQGDEGVRIRNWDSCMYPIFTLHGSGHQPRSTVPQRVRQRVMHKFNYYIEHFDIAACVGCGRCIRNCPVNLDIRRVLDELADVEKVKEDVSG